MKAAARALRLPTPWPRGRRCAASAAVHFITNESQARKACAELLPGNWDDGTEEDEASAMTSLGRAVAFDCEGIRLGRFGRVCLMQIRDRSRLLICDALRPGVVAAFAPLLSSRRVAKVVHDCREDSAALFHQHQIRLRAVFDTQAAFSALERRKGRTVYQASGSELLQRFLGLEDTATAELKKRMFGDPQVWARRPLSKELLHYAIHSVEHLLELREKMLEHGCEKDIVQGSRRAMDYCLLNQDFPTAQSMAKIGTRLWALVATRTNEKLLLKLNAGRVGMVSTPSALSRFQDVEPGDLVLCCVSGVSIDGRHLYLDRYDYDWDFFDHQLRPTGTPEVGAYGRELRHSTSMFAPKIDPLVVRGLPGVEADADPWDASGEDLGHNED